MRAVSVLIRAKSAPMGAVSFLMRANSFLMGAEFAPMRAKPFRLRNNKKIKENEPVFLRKRLVK
jgi:hypothetical protein